MQLASDDFELFGLPRRFEQDRAGLDTRWRALQSEVHPDRFAGQGAAVQRISVQWAARVNEAYRRLKDPMQRAAYLCELLGAPIRAEDNTAMPQDFLVQQLEWREALDAAATLVQVQQLADDVAERRTKVLTQVQQLLDHQSDAQAASAQVRALMFIERFAEDVDRRLEALGH
jgi:molecular chaperone HscB